MELMLRNGGTFCRPRQDIPSLWWRLCSSGSVLEPGLHLKATWSNRKTPPVGISPSISSQLPSDVHREDTYTWASPPRLHPEPLPDFSCLIQEEVMEPLDRGTRQGCPLQQDLHTWEGAPETLLVCLPLPQSCHPHRQLSQQPRFWI